MTVGPSGDPAREGAARWDADSLDDAPILPLSRKPLRCPNCAALEARLAVLERSRDAALRAINAVYPAVAGRAISLRDQGETNAQAAWEGYARTLYDALQPPESGAAMRAGRRG